MIENLILIILVFIFHYPIDLKKLLIYFGVNLTLYALVFFLPVPWIIFTMVILILDNLLLGRDVSGSLIYQFVLLLIMAFIAGCTYLQWIKPLIAEIILMCLYFVAVNNQRAMKKSYEQSMNEYQNTVMSRQVEEVNHLYMTMRGWRHDYHNHLQSLKAYMTKSQYQEAYEYLDALEDDLDDITQIVTTGNVKVDAILNSKFSLALNNNIQLDFKATVPEHMLISDLDLCVLIGNLVDNAVEACYQLEEKDRFIRFYMGTYKKQFYLSMTNATNEVIRKLDEEYITKKRGNHGHGLKRINNVVEKYNGLINRKNEPGVFVTEVMLPLGK